MGRVRWVPGSITGARLSESVLADEPSATARGTG